MAATRGRLPFFFIVALVATSVGSVLLPLGLSASHDSVFVGIALNVWAILLAPSSLFITLVFSPAFALSKFRVVMTLAFVFNVLAWTSVLYGISRLIAKIRRRPTQPQAGPA